MLKLDQSEIMLVISTARAEGTRVAKQIDWFCCTEYLKQNKRKNVLFDYDFANIGYLVLAVQGMK